jgi:hypothetical protein
MGTFGVTIINSADLFIAPYSDVHSEGFIAISNITAYPKKRLASCYISIKGPKNRINDYLMAINEIRGRKGLLR